MNGVAFPKNDTSATCTAALPLRACTSPEALVASTMCSKRGLSSSGFSTGTTRCTAVGTLGVAEPGAAERATAAIATTTRTATNRALVECHAAGIHDRDAARLGEG